MSFLRPFCRAASLATLLAFLAAGMHAQVPSQSQNPPSLPTPTPAAASSLPSIPAATPVPPPQNNPTPTQTEQTQPAAPVARPFSASKVPSLPPYDPDYDIYANPSDNLGSTYIPDDSPIYPMALRLYSLGYLDSAFISMRPWTRRSLLHMLEKTHDDIVNFGDDQAEELYVKLEDALTEETPPRGFMRGRVYGIQSVYTRLMGIHGVDLRDSFHLGQTIVDDYGRPYAPGFNAIVGFSSVNEMGRFSLYIRGEYEHAPSSAGYSLALANQLSCDDQICPFAPPNDPQATIPYGATVAAQNPFRLQEAVLSFHLLGHEISGGKSDAWQGPGLGGAMGWSNNAEDIYSFRINRIEPMHVPLLSRFLGPLRYDFFVGSLKGHTDPNSPWIHSEMFSFKPTSNFEFAFQRAVIWGGEGHEPVTLHTFLRSFFSVNDTTASEKFSPQDPGARFSAFTFSWRLPFLTHSVTLYTDSEVHDDVTPISAPRRAAFRPGIYISHLPGLPKMDFRAEGFNTDISTLASQNGGFMYVETVQKQGYTNKGFILGDWTGREAKGGQAWLTYNLAPGQWVQAEFLTKETAKDFITNGVHQNDYKIDVVKRIRPDIELHAWVQFERWSAPVAASAIGQPTHVIGGPLYYATPQHDTTIAAQFTWYPKLHTSQYLNGK
jgi:hypothetical protein